MTKYKTMCQNNLEFDYSQTFKGSADQQVNI